MTTEEAVSQDLRLEPLDERSAAELGTQTIDGGGPVLLGRARGCDICFQDPSVSRRHASLVKRDGRWFVVDLGGWQGTYLNGVRLEADQPAVAAQGDFIRLGPYSFRLVIGGTVTTTLAKTDHQLAADTIVERVSHREIGSLAQKRLDLLIDGAVAIHQATDEDGLGEAIVQLALAGTGFPRAALLRSVGTDQVEVMVSHGSRQVRGEFTFSRSLIREAGDGHVARLSRRGGQPLGQSIEQLGITGALCAPIVIDASVVGYLYLDSREDEQPGYGDAAGFCHAVSRLAGLALANLKRADLQRRQSRLEQDLKGARQAQAFLCPSGEGEVGPLRFAMQTEPGQFVAGDLFDIFPLDENRVGICFGDVSGHGMAAALHMTAVLAHMRAVLTRYGEPAAAMRDVNRYIAQRSPADMFVTLWVGVFNGATGVLQYVDAGHGYWFVKRSGGTPESAPKPNGLLVGIDSDYLYEAREVTLGGGDRIVIYSDGLVEQTNSQGEQFGKQRAIDLLDRSQSVADDVSSLFAAVKKYAGTILDDDTTVASIERKN
ncbi:MAG: SpoIIE family protein phosphatase [Planctomycetes bacterium]|nr:SpoIIE family protein phosphatase [Planctomycetota bacterium]